MPDSLGPARHYGKSVSDRESDPMLGDLLRAHRLCVRGVRKMVAADLGVGVDRINRTCVPPEDGGEPPWLEMQCRIIDRALLEKPEAHDEALAPVRYLVDRYLVTKGEATATGEGVVLAGADVLGAAARCVDQSVKALRDGSLTAAEQVAIRDARGDLARSIHILDKELEAAQGVVRLPVRGEVR